MVNFLRKTAYSKILSLFLAFTVIFVICACEMENPWMKEIMQEKTISFNTNGGSSVPSQTLIRGERVTKPANPSKAGSVFLDWYKDNGTFKEPYDFSFVPYKDMTLYARWDTSEVVMPSIVFDDIDKLISWLADQDDNTPVNPYQITLKFDNITMFANTNTLDGSIAEIINIAKKYVNIKLISNKLTTIGDSAFPECQYLTGITIPGSVKSIEEGAFYDCENLTRVTIPNSVTNIGDRTFFNCTSLTSVTIPNSVTSIGGSAFSNCTSLTSVTLPTNANFTKIGFGTFSNTSLKSITIPKSVAEIGGTAFYCCTNLTSITLPANAKFTKIGIETFENCSSLKSITIPNSVSEIGNKAFLNCTNLTSITLPANANFTKIDNSTFSNCTSLANITIPGSVTEIGQNAFNGCTSLTSVTIPSSVNSIASKAFDNCTNLARVTFAGDVSSLDISAFPGNLYAVCTESLAPPIAKQGTYIRSTGSPTLDTWTKQP